ncbi:hypothetical protein JYT74_01160 [Crocinitomix catalasitica]|nr:hypothetical protein [Crocinitomix catalasitica]
MAYPAEPWASSYDFVIYPGTDSILINTWQYYQACMSESYSSSYTLHKQ